MSTEGQITDEMVEAAARVLAPTAFEKASGMGHQEFAEEDRAERRTARELAAAALRAALDVGPQEGPEATSLLDDLAAIAEDHYHGDEPIEELRGLILGRIAEARAAQSPASSTTGPEGGGSGAGLDGRGNPSCSGAASTSPEEGPDLATIRKEAERVAASWVEQEREAWRCAGDEKPNNGPPPEWDQFIALLAAQSPASSTTPEQRAKELGITDTSPQEGVNQADLDRGAELDDQHGWSGEGPRCGGSGEVIDTPADPSWPGGLGDALKSPCDGCPDCGGPAYVEKGPSGATYSAPCDCSQPPPGTDPAKDLPPELAAALREPGVFVPADARLWDVIGRWADAPSNTMSALPPPPGTVGEGDEDPVARWWESPSPDTAGAAIRHLEAQRDSRLTKEQLIAAVEADGVLAKAVAALKDAEADPEWRWDKPGNLVEVRNVFLDAALAAFGEEAGR